jgi:RimJ/RimL family protein N-acetyltransferase
MARWQIVQRPAGRNRSMARRPELFNGPMADIRDRSHPPLTAELHGDGLRLGPWDPDSDADAEAWLRGLTDPEFLRWNTPVVTVTDPESARASLRAKRQHMAEGRGMSFRVADAATGAPLGHIGVDEINHVMRVAHIGYWVLPEARGRRVATRALTLATHWAFTTLGLHRLEIGHALGHDTSCHIAERCGYRPEGTLRDAMWEAGRQDAFRDVHLHARLATDVVGRAG